MTRAAPPAGKTPGATATAAAPVLSQSGPKAAAIVRGSRGGWRLRHPRRQPFLLSLCLRRLGPNAFWPLSCRGLHTGA
jgi:hypothetical protein